MKKSPAKPSSKALVVQKPAKADKRLDTSSIDSQKVTGPKIVFIDDEQELGMRRYIGEMNRLGYSTVHARMFAEYEPILDGLDHQDATLFVIDMRMPAGNRWTPVQTHYGEYTGVCIAKELRERLPNTPIILWTALMEVDIRSVAERHVKAKPRMAFIKKDLAEDLSEVVTFYFEQGDFPAHWKRTLWAVLKWALKNGIKFFPFDGES